jgi:hypothetical protein
MRHTWKRGGSNGVWVHHSSRDDGTGSDNHGVGLGGDVLGPFQSRRLALQVSEALNQAYRLGLEDGPKLGESIGGAVRSRHEQAE